MAKVDVSYKVKFGFDSKKTNTPLSIVRLMEGEGIFQVECCNQYKSWTPAPHLISHWIGGNDGDWHSAPEGEDMPIEFIDKWINTWTKGWPG